MKPLVIVPTDELADAVANEQSGPAVLDANSLMMLISLADRASLLAPKIIDPNAAEAVRLLSLAVDMASSLLTTMTSAIHHGSVGVVHYPEALSRFSGATWGIETQEGRQRVIDSEVKDAALYMAPERLGL
jgi:hypothetical protein